MPACRIVVTAKECQIDSQWLALEEIDLFLHLYPSDCERLYRTSLIFVSLVNLQQGIIRWKWSDFMQLYGKWIWCMQHKAIAETQIWLTSPPQVWVSMPMAQWDLRTSMAKCHCTRKSRCQCNPCRSPVWWYDICHIYIIYMNIYIHRLLSKVLCKLILCKALWRVFFREFCVCVCAAIAGDSCRKTHTCLQPWLFGKFQAVMADMISTAPPIVFRYFLCPYTPLKEIYQEYTASSSTSRPLMSADSNDHFLLLYFICIMDFLQSKNMLKKMTQVSMISFWISWLKISTTPERSELEFL